VSGTVVARAVVKIMKAPGYASAVINAGTGGNGSSIQIHAYPNGR
jgi:hypothetical protein